MFPPDPAGSRISYAIEDRRFAGRKIYSSEMSDGMVVYRLSVQYLAPVLHDAGPVRVDMWASDVRAASFVLHYTMRPRADERRLVVAETTMVPYELATGRPRRLAANEEQFLLQLTEEDAASA